jgi:alcohol dehydrogenase class IV
MSANLRGNWNYPTTIWAGPGRIAELGAACARAGMTRPLIVTDEGLLGTPMIDGALAALKAAAGFEHTAGLGHTAVLEDAAVFGAVRGNPALSHVEAGLAAYRSGGHDGVVAFGGGSALDAGKVVAFMSGQSRPLWDFEDIGDWWTRADPAGIAPVVAVPTTAGTGSEVGRAGVILNEQTHQKKIIFHPLMMPRVVIADAELTVGLPRAVTAATGIDAFVHCFEAFCAPGFHPLADGVALEGMRLIHRFLPRACANGKDIEARAQMLAAASMGATAFQKGLGGVHAIAHPVGSWFNTHHGLTNAVILPYVMRFNRHAISDKTDVIARVLDLPERGFDGFLAWVLALRTELGIPHSLADIGVTTDNAAVIGREAAIDPSASGNPIPVDAAQLQHIFRAAVNGTLSAVDSAA